MFLVAHFGFNFIVYILVGYSLFMFPSKERFKGICPVVNLCEFFRQKPLSDFFAKRTPKKTLSDFPIFDLGTTNCFIANSLLSPLLHVKIYASVGNQRSSYEVASNARNHLFCLTAELTASNARNHLLCFCAELTGTGAKNVELGPRC